MFGKLLVGVRVRELGLGPRGEERRGGRDEAHARRGALGREWCRWNERDDRWRSEKQNSGANHCGWVLGWPLCCCPTCVWLSLMGTRVHSTSTPQLGVPVRKPGGVEARSE